MPGITRMVSGGSTSHRSLTRGSSTERSPRLSRFESHRTSVAGRDHRRVPRPSRPGVARQLRARRDRGGPGVRATAPRLPGRYLLATSRDLLRRRERPTTRCDHSRFRSPPIPARVWARVRVCAPVRRARSRGSTGLRGRSGELVRGPLGLRTARRDAARDRARRGAAASALTRANRGRPERALRAAHRRQAHRAATPPNARAVGRTGATTCSITRNG